jgi:ABC-type phosphate transport system substrate-binding protein
MYSWPKCNKEVNIKHLFHIIIIALLLTIISSNASAVSVIVNKTVNVDEISRAELRRIYTMRTVTWPSKQGVVVFVLPSKNAVHQAFCKQQLKIFPYQLDRIWNKLTYSGMGVSPIVISTEQLLIEAVANTPGAIGYVDGSNISPQIKFIEIKG